MGRAGIMQGSFPFTLQIREKLESEIIFSSLGKFREFDKFRKIWENSENLITLTKIQGEIRELKYLQILTISQHFFLIVFILSST